MPEGDTVFLTARHLNDLLAGKTLLRAELRHPRLSTVELAGQTLLGVRSYGKRIFVRFSSELSLHNHLRMDGSWHLYKPGEKWRKPAHQARVVFEVDDRQAIGFSLHDMELLPTAEEDRLISHLGPDLLADEFDVDEAVSRLVADPSREVGLALLDQRVVAGIGNLYKTEVCFMLRVSPWAPVSAVDARKAMLLSRKLLWANRWRAEQVTTGDLRQPHYVYGRAGRPCFKCGTRVKSGTQGSGTQERVAYFCPGCQNG
jgi:endonuclease VIII